MMSTTLPQRSAVEQSEPDQHSSNCQVGRSAIAALGSCQRNGDTVSSSPESCSLNGEGKRSGKSRRRKKRSSKLESPPKVGQADSKSKNKYKPDKVTSESPDHCTGLIGLQSDCSSVWFERSIYEQAESLYQCWLAGSSNRTSQSTLVREENSKSLSILAPSSSGPVCHHGNQVACHHVVRTVWLNKTSFDQAECGFVEESLPAIPNSLNLPSHPNRSIVARTPDEGYQSLAPTPATPVQQAVVAPTNRRSINGLPHIPVELLRDVWLEKPLYDRAEAAFYKNLYGNNSYKRSSCASTSRSNDHPQSLVEEDEEEEEEDKEVEEKQVVPHGKGEIFHALLPIQEEEEPVEVVEKEVWSGAGIPCFLHPDSEPVWLDKWRYDAAESHYHVNEAAVVKKSQRPDATSFSSSTLLRDKTMASVDFLAQEKIWFDKPCYDEAERLFYERMNRYSQPTQDVGAPPNTILQDIARARENIQKSLAGSSSSSAADQGEVISRIRSLELENQSFHKVVEDLRAALCKLEGRVAVLENSPAAPAPTPSVPCTNGTTVQQKSNVPITKEQEEKEDDDEDDDDDIDLFGSDDDDEEAEKLKEQRLKDYAEKKAKKPALIAKSSILLDVKPWDDETDMVKLEECVRSVQADGLLWGTSKLVPVGYGIKKLQIACVVEDDKVGTDLLEEEITKFEDFVQSVDVAAFNKI